MLSYNYSEVIAYVYMALHSGLSIMLPHYYNLNIDIINVSRCSLDMPSITVLWMCYSICSYLVLILFCTTFGVFNSQWNSCDNDLVEYYRNLHMDFPIH